MTREEAAQKAKDLVAGMTLEEKISQLRFDAPEIPRLGIPAYNWWNEAQHGVARAGTATVFPRQSALRRAGMRTSWRRLALRSPQRPGPSSMRRENSETGISTRELRSGHPM